MRHPSGQRPHAIPGRAGQTLVVALSVMFLLFFIGALFVAMIARNLTRVEYVGNRTSAQALAESGVNWVNTQLTYSELGADWRPSPTWPARGSGQIEAIRQRDPDYPWLSDGGTYQKPYTRIPSGDGRFLIRVDYDPSYQSAQPNDTTAFDPLSLSLHIRSVGRPGRIDPNDPTQLVTPNNPNLQGGQIPGYNGKVFGQFQELEAWKPIGLTDQLWWITNKNKERGPAQVGLAPLQDGQGQTVLYQQTLNGGVRSNMDVTFEGPTQINLYPRSGQGVFVNGSIQMATLKSGGANANTLVPVTLNLLDERTNTTVTTVNEGPSDVPGALNPFVNAALAPRGVFLDDQFTLDNQVPSQRSVLHLEPPSIDLTESGSSANRYVKMTRDSGMTLAVTEGGATKQINAGLYGWGDGIYVDNYSDIQYPDDRQNLVNEWLRRGPADISQTGWSGSFYTPSVRESGTVHPILDVELRPDGILLTRFDRDVLGHNLGTDNQYTTRIFYQAFSKNNPNQPPAGPTDVDTTKGLKPVGPSILMPYPPNGVLYAEGSLRIRGTFPVSLTVVSGGTIYIEGSLVKSTASTNLALLAHDYVCLNPTQFTSVRPYEDVTIQPDGPGASSFHYEVPQDKDLDLVFTNSTALTGTGMLLNLQHTAGFSDNSSNTSVSMYVNGLDEGHRYNFQSAAVKPQYPPAGGSAVGGGSYLFRFFPPPTDANWWLNSWGTSNFQSSPASTVNYEQKSFWIPTSMLNTTGGAENRFRFHVEATPNGQPWWLAGASLVPYQQPLNVEVDALMYAQNASWFVVPPAWFNENELDSRTLFQKGDGSASRQPGLRANGTFPANTDDYPFYREPLNIVVNVKGSISEATSTASSDKAQWVKKMSLAFTDPTNNMAVGKEIGLPNTYQADIHYVYDPAMRNWVRWRNVVTGAEGIAYAGPPAGANGAPTVDAVRQAAMGNQTTPGNIVTLPIIPRLPTSGTLYRGRPL